MKPLLALALMTAAASTLSAQPTLLSLDELIPGGKHYLYPAALLDAHWTDAGDFSYTLGDTVTIVAPDGRLRTRRTVAEADSIAALTRPAFAPRGGKASADGEWSAVTDGDRLYVVQTATGLRREVSDSTATEVVWGQSVHRNEFGIDGGIFWSPQGHRLAFYRMDESMVQAYPLVNTDAREAEVRFVKYPMAGMTSHQVTLGVYNPDTGATVYLKTRGEGRDDVESAWSDPEHYLTCVTWRPDGSEIFIAELDRAQREMRLNAYDAATGDFVRTLFVERDDRYVEPQHPLSFLPGSNDRFIWQSQRDGWNHLYLYDLTRTEADGSLAAPVQLTEGPWCVTQLVAIAPSGRTVYFLATEASPMEDQLYQVSVSNGARRRLTTEPGVHRVKMNAACTAFYDTYAAHDVPRRSQLVTVRNGRRHLLHEAADPYAGRRVPQISVGTLLAADDSTTLYYRLVRPTNFEPGRKYPAVVYLYNGPHAQMVTEGWNYAVRGWDIHMANLGYVVFTIDGRGGERRGLAFEQAIWHNLGHVEGLDQMRGIDFLRSLPYVDSDRIGIHGWSYGGFMTTYMMTHYPETFRVGVAGGPVLDWSRYEIMYGERYMGTPQDNPDGYAAARLIDKADRLRGRLLLIHGDQDNVVVPQHTMQFIKNAVAVGTHPDLYLYPGHEHNVHGVDRVHLHEHITRYFEEHLK